GPAGPEAIPQVKPEHHYRPEMVQHYDKPAVGYEHPPYFFDGGFGTRRMVQHAPRIHEIEGVIGEGKALRGRHADISLKSIQIQSLSSQLGAGACEIHSPQLGACTRELQ